MLAGAFGGMQRGKGGMVGSLVLVDPYPTAPNSRSPVSGVRGVRELLALIWSRSYPSSTTSTESVLRLSLKYIDNASKEDAPEMPFVDLRSEVAQRSVVCTGRREGRRPRCRGRRGHLFSV